MPVKLYGIAPKKKCRYDLIYPNKIERVNVYENCYDSLGKMTKSKWETVLRQRGYFYCKLYRTGFLKETYSYGGFSLNEYIIRSQLLIRYVCWQPKISVRQNILIIIIIKMSSLQ